LSIECLRATFVKSTSSSVKVLLPSAEEENEAANRQPANRRESAMSQPSERHLQVCHWNGSQCHHFDAQATVDHHERPTAARYYREVASTALDRMRNLHEGRAEAIAMAAALTDTAPYVGIGSDELTADEISVVGAILLAIA
jgi:hypothetical protein